MVSGTDWYWVCACVCVCSQFPPLSSDEARHRYKQTFNSEYAEYIQLKNDIDEVAGNYRTVCSRLGERLDSVPKHSDEYKVGVVMKNKWSHL